MADKEWVRKMKRGPDGIAQVNVPAGWRAAMKLPASVVFNECFLVFSMEDGKPVIEFKRFEK